MARAGENAESTVINRVRIETEKFARRSVRVRFVVEFQDETNGKVIIKAEKPRTRRGVTVRAYERSRLPFAVDETERFEDFGAPFFNAASERGASLSSSGGFVIDGYIGVSLR